MALLISSNNRILLSKQFVGFVDLLAQGNLLSLCAADGFTQEDDFASEAFGIAFGGCCSFDGFVLC